MAFDYDADLGLVDALGSPLRERPNHTYSNRPQSAGFGLDLSWLDKMVNIGRIDLGDGVAFQLFAIAVVAFRVVDEPEDASRVVLEFDTVLTDRDSAAKGLSIKFSQKTARESWENKGAKAHIIRQCLRSIVMHEVDENIYVDGKREFDPHSIRKVELTVRFGDEEDSSYKFSPGSRYLR